MTVVLKIDDDNNAADIVSGGLGLGYKLGKADFNVDTGRLIVLADSEAPDKPTIVFAVPEAEVAAWQEVVGFFPERFADRTDKFKEAIGKVQG